MARHRLPSVETAWKHRLGRMHRVYWHYRNARNVPNSEACTGSRVYVKGTVGSVRKCLKQAKVEYKKVRIAAGKPGFVEVIYTSYRRWPNPYSVLREAGFECR